MNAIKTIFLTLFALFCGTLVYATCDFEKAPIGQMRDFDGWHAPNIKPGAQIVDTKDDFHKKALKLSPSNKHLVAFYKFTPASSGALEIDFDFKANSYKIEPRISVALKNTDLKLLPYKAAVWLGLGYKNKLYYFSQGWKALDEFELNKWHHLKIIVHISGTRAGTFDVNLNGGEFEGIGLKWRNQLAVSPKNPLGNIFFQINRKSTFKGNEYLMIDNLRVAKAGVDTKMPKISKQQADSRIVNDSFYSKILGKKKNFTVIMPDNYKKSTVKYPVLYIFHGRGRHERSLVDNSRTRSVLMTAEFITVLPDGDDNWYINSPVDKKSSYNDYIEELMIYVENSYPISKERKKRGLAGWSMGGYGCTMFAEAHPEQFSALAPIIALLDYPRHGLPKGQSYGIQIKRFGKDPDIWKKFNPVTNAGKLKNMKLFIITAKKCFTLTMNRNFVARLKELDIPVEYVEINGGHSFAVVTTALSRVISFMNKTIGDRSKRR
ncbi:MAG: hypothetical protein L3J71_17105 [Victivallaceae bacterium]|nr:hypothetical protein [Victivallaceae bacterium]